MRRPNTFITAVLGEKINTIYRSDDCTHLRLNIIYHFNFVQAKVKHHVSPVIDWRPVRGAPCLWDRIKLHCGPEFNKCLRKWEFCEWTFN